MKLKTSSIVIAVTTLLFLVLAGRYGFTVVSIEEAENTVQSEAFDPVAYVDGIWESKLLPTFNEKAVELPKILSEMQLETDGTASKENLITIANEYGLITEGEAHVYMVKGSGVISSVNIETSKGTAEVALEGYNGPIKVLLYLGPRLPGDDASVRDATGLVKFGDFKEQTEFGKVAKEMNDRVLQGLDTLDRENLNGKTVSFKGAFTIRTYNLLSIDLKEIYIIPVEIELGG
jgi:predicted lipoprotein